MNEVKLTIEIPPDHALSAVDIVDMVLQTRNQLPEEDYKCFVEALYFEVHGD